MVHDFNLKGKVILITGGYGYLGKSITESLLFHGATVYVLGRDENKFMEAFPNRDKNMLLFQFCDISITESILAALKSVYSNCNKVDVLINNAYFIKGQSPVDMTDDEWMNGIEGTLSSVFKFIRSIIPHFLEANSGKIINVSSMYGIVSPDFSIYDDFPNFLNPPHYGVSKAGIIQLTKYYANYLGKFGITVNTVTPGPFPSLEVQNNSDFINKLCERTSLNRIGNPEDLAGAFVFLASDASNFITGQNIIVDGGWTSK